MDLFDKALAEHRRVRFFTLLQMHTKVDIKNLFYILHTHK